MKRMICLFCSLLLLFGLSQPVYAADEYDELRQEIQEAAETFERIDVSQYGLTQEELQEIYQDLFHRGLLPWYADSYFDWSGSPDGYVTVISVRDLRKRSFDEDLYLRSLAELIAQTCHEGMTPTQMVLSVHDFIVARTEYSIYRATNNNGYHALVLRETACYGYAQLFLRIMTELGIPCQIVISDATEDSAGHAWNVVQLDGNWYHIDLTWDDPITDAAGRVMHDRFLKTDKDFQRDGHTHPWRSEVECTASEFPMDPVWEDLDSPVIFPNGEIMLYRRDDENSHNIYSRDLKTGHDQLLFTMDRQDVVMDGWYYTCPSAGLSCRNDRIWFNTPDSIYSIDMNGGNLIEEYHYDTREKGAFLYSFFADNELLCITLMDPNENMKTEKLELDSGDCHNHDYISDYVDATCTQGGYSMYRCSCGVEYTLPGKEALGHAFEEGTICSRCGFAEETLPPETQPSEAAETETTRTDPPAEDKFPVVWIAAGILGIGLGFVFACGRKKKSSEKAENVG